MKVDYKVAGTKIPDLTNYGGRHNGKTLLIRQFSGEFNSLDEPLDSFISYGSSIYGGEVYILFEQPNHDTLGINGKPYFMIKESELERYAKENN